MLRRASLLVCIFATASCGRVGYELAPPIAQVEVRALDGTSMLQGETLRIEVTIEPPEAAIFGRVLTISAEPGRLNGQHELEVTAPDGEPVVIELSAGMDVRDGRMLILDSDAPAMGGDLRYLVEAGPTALVDVDGVQYEVADGLSLDAPLPGDVGLMGRSATLLMAHSDSGFGPGPLVVAGDPFELLDGSSGSLVPVPLSGTLPGDGRLAQAQLVSGDGYDEQIYACVAGAGGGLYSILPGGAISLVRAGACNGVVRYGSYVYIHAQDVGIDEGHARRKHRGDAHRGGRSAHPRRGLLPRRLPEPLPPREAGALLRRLGWHRLRWIHPRPRALGLAAAVGPGFSQSRSRPPSTATCPSAP